MCTQSFHTLECVNSCCDPLLHVDEVPPWQRRDFIVTGYHPMLSIFNAFLSIFFLHNESGNIWTHLSGVVYTLYVFWQFIQTDLSKSDYLSVFMIVFFIFTVLTVFVSSTVYHTLICGSYGCLFDEGGGMGFGRCWSWLPKIWNVRSQLYRSRF